jgi:hypothetical protein
METQNWFDRLGKRLRSGADWVTEALVLPPQPTCTTWQRAARWAWMGGAYLLVLVVWIFFLNGGRIPFGIPDWGQEWAFDSTLQQSLRQGILPLHTSVITYGTDRFLAIPQTILSPQTLLLRFISIEAFLMIQAVLLLTVGFVGCLALMKYLRLSPLAGSLLFLLVALNGHLIAQVAVGHVMWLGIFILPFFFLLLLRLLDGRAGRRWALAMALTLFFLLLQGSIHLYIWCLFFLGLIWLVERRHRRDLFEAGLLSGLLGAFRLLPAGLAFSEASSTSYPGYPSLAHVIVGLVFPLPPSEQLWLTTSAGWWEFDMYLGILGLAFVAIFGVILPLRRQDGKRPAIYIASAVMALLALGYLYLPFRLLPIPLISHERVPSRFLALALLAMIVAASEGFQRWLDRVKPGGGLRLVMMVLLLILGQDLVQHARLWRLELVAQALAPHAVETGLRIANRPDPAYTSILLISVVISFAAIGYGIFRARNLKRWRSASDS